MIIVQKLIIIFQSFVIIGEYDIDSTSYEETINDINAKLWQEVMKSKMESIYSNKVWKLLEALKEIKSIGCK